MGATIFIVEVTYFDNNNNNVVAKDEVNRIFLDEEDAKGYCNLMNVGRQSWLYTYNAYNICTKDYKKYA